MAQSSSDRACSLPWSYNISDVACATPLGPRLIDIEDVRFTQSHVNDSFSHEMRPVMEMVTALLIGTSKVSDIPMIRVAWRDGAFWSIDNRRTFVFKHCKVGRVCVQVCDWATDKEFDMKWRGGNELRDQSAGGKRAGLTQRLKELAFPNSEVIAFDMSKNDVSKLMEKDEQVRHDDLVSAFSAKRKQLAEFEDLICAQVNEAWCFEANVSESCWLPATILEAHIDGTFDAILLDGTVQFFRPRLAADQLRNTQTQTSSLLQVQTDLHQLNMTIPAGMPSRLTIPWCAICAKRVAGEARKLRQHEEHEHRNRFSCSTCKRRFTCSDNLRKHSRSTQHEIPAAFGRYLVARLAGDDSEDEGHVSDHDKNEAKANEQPDVERPVFVVPSGGASAERGSAKTRCALCHHECTAKELSPHEERLHRKEYFECQSCHATFTNSKNLRKHSRSTCHKILCTFMLESERAECGANAPDESREHTSERVVPQGSSFQQARPAMPPETILYWLHTQSGTMLRERPANTEGAKSAVAPADWSDLILERWRSEEGRFYLWCPANGRWFWEDESKAQGWHQKKLRSD